MLLKACGRCGDLIPYGRPYCSKCTPIIEEDRTRRREERDRVRNLEAQKRYNKKRDPKYGSFYNSKAWRTLSAKYAQDKGFRCEVCGEIATEVHHKRFISTPDGWDRRLDYTNLELLCVKCHNLRHDRFKPHETERKRRKSIKNVDISS